MEFICQNVYEEAFLQRFKGFFDVIILKDAIEHIPEQGRFIPYLKNFLKPGGFIFFGFPPWYMPFGGHQQIAEGKLASKLPYYHILPKPLYKGMLKLMGEKGTIGELMNVYDTRISIERFERIVRNSGMKVLNKQHYLINPIYKYKFGLQPRKQWPPLTYIPFIRNFVTTCVYYSVG
jgi:SAM-dependent methyltransferase